MMVKVPLSLWVLLFVGNIAHAQNKYFLPQVANGNFGTGSYRTTFLFANNTDSDTAAVLQLTGNDGLPLVITIDGLGTNDTFSVPVAAGGSRMLQTNGLGGVATGAATVTSTSGIVVSAIFSIYDDKGNFLTEAGVGNSEPVSEFVLPVDTTGLSNTGLALLSLGTSDSSITMILRDTSGVETARTALQLASGAHKAAFISGPNQLFPAIANFRGTLLVQSPTPVAATVLRENQTPLSFTSLPVVPVSATSRTLNLPHVVNGSFGGGSYQTSFLIFNISSVPADVNLTLTRDDGSPYSLRLGGVTSDVFSFPNLAPGASLFLQTDGSGAVASGAGTISANVPIGASGVFTVLDSSGAFQTETAVGVAPMMTSITMPVDVSRPNFDTGIALFNPGTSTATLALRLLDSNGAVLASSSPISLPAKGHVARFVGNDLFKTLKATGSLAINATSGISALILRENSEHLSFTTLPAGSGANSDVAPLLSQGGTIPTVTGNVTQNAALPPAFRLRGAVTGHGKGLMVITGPYQFSNIDPQTGTYLIALPAGTYSVTVSFIPDGIPSGESVFATYAVPGTVGVNGDTNLDIAIPSTSLVTVSGSVNGLSSLAPFSNARIIFTSNDSSVSAELSLGADGSYQGVVPPGSYATSVTAFLESQKETIRLSNLGPATINGNTTLQPFAVPALAKLTGTVRGLPGLLYPPVVMAYDQSGVGGGCTINVETGQYQMILPKGRAYGFNVGMTMPLGAAVTPVPALGMTLDQDTSLDFTIPGLPAQVTFSGTVTDSKGNPLSGVAVSAFSPAITGTPNLLFSAAGSRTDSNGHYSMNVLSGTNYSLSFTPPTPRK